MRDRVPEEHTEYGVRDSVKREATGLFPIGDGYFYISHDRKSKDNKQATTILKYKWIGKETGAFISADK